MALSRNVLLALNLVHCAGPRVFPAACHYTSKFFHLQHAIDHHNGVWYYDIGSDDCYYVVTWVLLLTFFRSFLIHHVFRPVARWFRVPSGNPRTRFAEQAWDIVYYCLLFAVGSLLYYRSPYWRDLDHVFIGWPHYRMDALFKKYYLVSIAFWLQQCLVLNVEKKRKDHAQMFSHHIITVALVVGSYYYYYNRIGNLILIIMDSVDIFLSSAKVLKYAGYSRACDFMFILFLISWIVLRHGVYNYLFYHAWVHSRRLMAPAKCVLGLLQKRCWNLSVVYTFLSLLGGLQLITCVWMYLILKVAYKVITGKGAEDVRSDDEDDDSVEDRVVSDQENDQHKNKSSDITKNTPEPSDSADEVVAEKDGL